MLRPDKNIQRVMISTPSHFVGEFENKKILITLAIPQFNNIIESWTIRKTYIIASFIGDSENNKRGINNLDLGEFLSVLFSVLYGKRFDNHGVIEQNGRFYLPSIIGLKSCKFTECYFNNDKPRKNLNVNLHLENIKIIEKLINLEFEDDKKLDLFFASAKLYLESLRLIDYDSENAFINLIMAGEILSGSFREDFSEDKLYDEIIRKQFEKIRSNLIDGEEIIKVLKNRLYQVKRIFTFGLLKLLNEKFFEGYEVDPNLIFMALKKDNIMKEIMSAYDLRSYYIHKGVKFGKYIEPMHPKSEIGLNWSNIEDEELTKLLKNSPSFLGMERIIRFCLLRFLALNRYIEHQDLNGQGLI